MVRKLARLSEALYQAANPHKHTYTTTPLIRGHYGRGLK